EASQLGGTTHPSRDAPVVTFDASWPAVRPRVVAVLRSRGVQEADVDDIAQEVAIRALRQFDRFASQEHFVRWSCRVAINAHIDTVRRGSRLVDEPDVEIAAPLNVAETVEGRLALDAALLEVASLSPEDRALLFDPPVAVDRKDAVRLAVRRHRLRARLANMLEGMLAGVPILRRLRADSLPVRAAMVAVPVAAAVLSVLPLVTSGSSGTQSLQQRDQRAVAHGSAATRTHGPVHTGRGTATSVPDTTPAPAATPSRTILQLHPAGNDLYVRRDQKPPEDAHTLCVFGSLNVCVDRPGPEIPLPPLPLPGGPGPPS
ncbi:MAG TPA: sigma-70 family RNA polymerase sigma factor, partial [Acidimicrobiales bacterium]|nr:sigma-70 family RNA polymerase sigma factor [Acidimicrobiales bacterium]